jgi:hypothetical protein
MTDSEVLVTTKLLAGSLHRRQRAMSCHHLRAGLLMVMRSPQLKPWHDAVVIVISFIVGDLESYVVQVVLHAALAVHRDVLSLTAEIPDNLRK